MEVVHNPMLDFGMRFVTNEKENASKTMQVVQVVYFC